MRGSENLALGLLLSRKEKTSERVDKINNLHILFCLNHSYSSTNLKYEPNSKVPVLSVTITKKTGLAHLNILILLITNHDLDKEVLCPRWNWLLANVLD